MRLSVSSKYVIKQHKVNMKNKRRIKVELLYFTSSMMQKLHQWNDGVSVRLTEPFDQTLKRLIRPIKLFIGLIKLFISV